MSSHVLSYRQKYIIVVVSVYLVLALAWILLSDRLLQFVFDSRQMMTVSMIKGMLFVLVTAAGLSLALKHMPVADNAADHPLPLTYRRSNFGHYLLAVLLVGLMMWFRLALPIEVAERPMIVLQLFPVILAAVLGGFGPGLLATVLATLAVGWVTRHNLTGPEQSFYIQLQWLFLLINGVTVSWLCQLLRNSALHTTTQRHLLQRVLEGSEQGFWEWDLHSGRIQVSARFETMLGYNPGEMDLRGDTWLELLHPADVAAAQSSIGQHLQGLTPFHEAEFRARCKDGSWRWILTRGKIVTRSADGQPLKLAGTHTDIEQRHRNEEALHLAELMFAGSYDGMMLVDADNRVIRVNPAFSRITGYSEADVLGKSPALLSSGLHEKNYYRQMWLQLHQHGFWRGEIINKRKDGSVYTEMLSISVVRDGDGQISQYIGIFADISQFKAHAAELDKVANFDALTGLPNRRLLLTRFNQTLIRALQMDQRCAVCLIDIDGFKQINDSYGSAFGDRVLLALSHQLQSTLRHDDTLARLGGDEFVVLLSDMPPLPEGNLIVKRLLKAVNKPLELDGITITLTCSIGVSLYPDDNADPDSLLRHADKAMFQAKESGRNRIQWFDPAHEREAQEHRMMLEQLREALQQQQFVLFYQPKVNLRTGQVVGMEALIRWQHPQRGLLAPAAFLPFIEGSELEERFGRFVLREGIHQAAMWQQQGIHLDVGINISASHLLASDFAEELASLLQRWPELSPQQVELEILESTAIRDLAAAREALLRCRSLGVRFALDDFGTGYSSLTYLRQLPVHCLKIDQSFVRDMLEDPDDHNIVSGVVQLAQVFARAVIAEGVESMAHARALLEIGCEQAQGYGIARPMPAAQVAGWMQDWQARQDWQQLQR